MLETYDNCILDYFFFCFVGYLAVLRICSCLCAQGSLLVILVICYAGDQFDYRHGKHFNPYSMSLVPNFILIN